MTPKEANALVRKMSQYVCPIDYADDVIIDGTFEPREIQALGLVYGPQQETFEEAWERMRVKGYVYGPDALEQVKLGWKLARGEV